MYKHEIKFEVMHHGYRTAFSNLRELKDYARFIRFAVASTIDDYIVIDIKNEKTEKRLKDYI